MRTLVLPTDFSKTSWHAAAYAIKLFGRKARYIVQHSYAIPSAGHHVLVSLDDVLRKQADRDMEEWVAKLAVQLDIAPSQLEPEVYLGSVVNGVAHAVKAHRAELVVMGTIGASDILERWMGSNTATVIRDLEVPVLAVPHGCNARIPHHLAFARDVGQPEGVANFMHGLAERWGATVSMFHVDTSEPDMVAQQTQAFAGSTTVKTIKSANVVSGIDAFCRANGVDMLAMYPQKRDFLERLFHRSLSRKISMRLAIPLLVLRNPRPW